MLGGEEYVVSGYFCSLFVRVGLFRLFFSRVIYDVVEVSRFRAIVRMAGFVEGFR